MTITLKRKNTNENLTITDAVSIHTNETYLGATGYNIHFTDGTCGLYTYKTWDLISVTI